MNRILHVAWTAAEDDHVSVIDLGDWSVRSIGSVDEPNGLALIDQ